MPLKKNDPDRESHFQACQNALEPYVEAIIAIAVKHGWDEMVATESVIALAKHHAWDRFAYDVEAMIKRTPPLDP